jgi:hypothetical protein
MALINVPISGGRIVTVMRGKLSPDAQKKKSSKPPHHDIVMACVSSAWMTVNELAGELLKREAVERVAIVGKNVNFEVSK